MFGIGISFDVSFDSTPPSSPEPKKKVAPAPVEPERYDVAKPQTFWDKMFFRNDAYIEDPGYGRNPETLAAHLAKEALQRPGGR